jgi:hypothetical protein
MILAKIPVFRDGHVEPRAVVAKTRLKYHHEKLLMELPAGLIVSNS